MTTMSIAIDGMTPEQKYPGYAARKAVLDKLRSMSGAQIAQKGLELFGDSIYQRTIFACWLRTVQNCEKRHINPRYYAVNLLGEPGYGKSGGIYEVGNIIGDWLSSLAGQRITFTTVTRTLAGINDFGDIIGITKTSETSQTTKIFRSDSFPATDDVQFGMVFIDDFNRGHDFIIAAAMEFVNTGAYNEYRLAPGFGIAAASNPQG